MISGPWNPGFQDSRSALELASFDWYQHVGYESHSVYVKKLDFQHRISKFHHSWKIPKILWNFGYCLEMANFLLILLYWASILLNFCHWTWIWPIQLKNVMFLIPLVSFGFWNKWHLKTSKWPCFLISVLNYCFVQIDKLLPSYNLRLFSWKCIRITITFSLCHPHHYFNLYVCSSLWCTAYGVCHTGTPSNDLMFLCSKILKFCVENQVSWHEQSGIHFLYVDISKN